MKLKSFGCSFIFGDDLADQIYYHKEEPDYSITTWPALMAKKLGLEYECYAQPGIGNFKILCDVVSQASLKDPAVFVINWTWIDRFDWVDDLEQWQTIRPGTDSKQSRFYFREFHSQIKDMITSVHNVNTAIDFLSERDIPFVMSYMDYTMLDDIDPNWHDPKYLSVLQHKCKRYLLDFDGKNFLDWSRDRGYQISANLHPLEDAHLAAADFMTPIVDAILHRA